MQVKQSHTGANVLHFAMSQGKEDKYEEVWLKDIFTCGEESYNVG